MSTCAQACEHDTQSAHDAACSHATVPVDVSSTAHCWFGTSSGTCCTAQCPAPLQSVSLILATKNDFPEGPVANQNCRARVGSGEDSKCCASATCPSGRSTRREHSVGTLFFARATRTHAPGGAVRRGSLQRELYRTAPARMPTPPIEHLFSLLALSPSTRVRKRLRGGPYLGQRSFAMFGHNLRIFYELASK